MKKYSPYHSQAFTLIELILGMGIFVLLIGGIFISFTSLYANMALDNYSLQIVSTIRKANQNSLYQLNNSSWGVYFDTNTSQFTLFAGDTYASRNQSFDNAAVLPSSVSLTNLELLGGGNEIVFQKANGHTNNSGSIYLINNTSKSVTITVNEWGLVDTN